MATKNKNSVVVTDEELKMLTATYSELSEPNRNLMAMNGNLLLASQTASREMIRRRPRRTG